MAKSAGKKKGLSRRQLGWIAGVLGAVLALLLLWALFGRPQAPWDSANALVIRTVERQEGSMVLTTSFCTLKYPYAFSDVLRVESEDLENGAALRFIAMINGTDAPVYTLWFNVESGDLLGRLRLGKHRYPVCCTLHRPPDTLTGGDLTTFYAVQESVNDILWSLEENQAFTPVSTDG